jgi:dienelactone hydrolase
MMPIQTEVVSIQHDATTLQGHLFSKKEFEGQRPAVIVCHAWAGCDDFARSAAERVVDLGYVGFAADLYGEGRVGASKEENAALMQPLLDDRGLLRKRLLSVFAAICDRKEVDAERVAVMGYCFGGLCALDLARTGCPLAATISFHGLLSSPNNLVTESIPGKVLVLHGHLDPMVSEEEIIALKSELTKAGADWQLHIYGRALHAFTNPEANDPDFGTVYDATTDRRSQESLKNVLTESFCK